MFTVMSLQQSISLLSVVSLSILSLILQGSFGAAVKNSKWFGFSYNYISVKEKDKTKFVEYHILLAVVPVVCGFLFMEDYSSG